MCPGPGREAKRFSNVSNKDVIDVIDVTWLRLKKSLFPTKLGKNAWFAGARLSGDRAGDTVRVNCLLQDGILAGLYTSRKLASI